MFYDFCPHCNQKLECEESMENMEVTCPSCGNNFVTSKESFHIDLNNKEKTEEKEEKKDDLKLKILTENNSKSVWTEEKEEKYFFENIKMGKPDLSNAFFSISVFHFFLASISFLSGFVYGETTGNFIPFLASIFVGLILAGWGFLFMAGSQFVRIIFYGALSCKKIKDMMEEDRKAKENPPAEP